MTKINKRTTTDAIEISPRTNPPNSLRILS
jgi:hypothetical protein